MGVFDWLNALMEWIGAWIPRLSICKANQSGVRFKHGSKISVISPGLFIYWPIVTSVQLLPTARQTLNLVSQQLTTKDDVTVAISLVVIFSITDVSRALVDTWDVEDTVGDVSLDAAVSAVLTRTWVELTVGLVAGDVQKEITRQCRTTLHPFGVRVEKTILTDIARTTVYSIMSDTNTTVLPVNRI